MAESEPSAIVLRIPDAKRRGRKPAQFWVSFTTQEEPYKQRSAACRHCLATVNYHKKWEQAKSHLMKCAPFLRQMQALDVYERPEWFSVELEKRRRSTARLLPIDLLRGEGEIGLTLPTRTTTTGKASGRPKKRDSLGAGSVIAASEMLLLQALRTHARIDADLFNHLLTREGGTSPGAVDYLYTHVRRAVHTILPGPLTLSVKWSKEGRTVEYNVANHKTSFFVEQASVPEPKVDEDEAIPPLEWLADDISRVVTTLGLSVQYCVPDISSEFAVSALPPISITLNNETRTIPWRPSPSRALIKMINNLLTQSTEEAEHPLEGLVETAMLCQDILRILDVPLNPINTSWQQLEQSRHIIGGLRSISLAEAFVTIVQADKVLGGVFPELVEQSTLSDSTKDALLGHVADPAFSTRMKRCRAVLHPLAEALEVLTRSVVAVSDVVLAFLTIRSKYNGDTTLSQDHKLFLVSLLARHGDMYVCGEYALMHLLDPAYVGELLDEEAKVKAEHELLSTVRTVPTDTLIQTEEEIKQALFVEYTQFQLAAVQVRTTQDGFVYRMLKERKKTVLEYWLTNGRRWPLLHAIALGIEQPPGDARPPEPAEAPTFLPEMGEVAKFEYLRRNVPLLSAAELLQESSLLADTLNMFGEGIPPSAGVDL